MLRSLFLFSLLFISFLDASKPKALYNSLDPQSVSQHFALYELYPESPEGKKALSDAWKLLSGGKTTAEVPVDLPQTIDSLISVVNKQPGAKLPTIDEKTLSIIDKLASHLPNRKLKGHNAKTEEEIRNLPPEEIDLARGLFLSEKRMDTIHSYEAVIDLLALQILARTSLDASAEEKIRAINQFIFDELRFRFPPESACAKEVDRYTFLPAVLDSRKGICLGVSILYLCLAERLHLPLEIVTPPGHIYVRYRNGDHVLNIETTARGVDTDSEIYLGIETRSLQTRNVKEVIGLAHMNEAANHWQNEDHEKALKAYEIAQNYLPDDMLLKEFMGLNYLFTGNTKKGETYLSEVKDHVPDYAVVKETLVEDYLSGLVDKEGIKPLFMHVDNTRESLLKKRDALQNTLKEHPQFRAGLFSLATTWLQLHRQDEALKILEKLHNIDPTQPAAEYYLSVLYSERLDYNSAWEHFEQSEKIAHARDHHPKALKELKRKLTQVSPRGKT